MRKWVMAVAMIAAMPVAASAADAEAGKTVFNKCKACHQIGAGAKNAVGPNLTGLIGRKAGTVEGFKYSEAMTASGKTWDEATLANYLKDPKKEIPGNKMVFMGLKDDAEIANVIAFIASQK